ncbi:unnamed protein product [Schistosoma curassoni]|uniref:DUF4806 domain-containing protein n=1 Tax=Schistosoma curassoni TaxID=6186 RepID=A0A183L291_9TREM|nr:unnamed protein product [Schistosoma curassoni]
MHRYALLCSSSKADVSSPLRRTSTEVNKPVCDETNKMLRMLLKSVSELSTKMDKMLFLCERLAMGVTDRRTEEMDSDATHFPLRTHEELCSLEAALENQKFRDHFVERLYHLLCEDPRKSAKASLQYLLSPELANTYTLHGTRSKFGIGKYKFYSTVQSSLCSLFRSASCPEKDIIHAMATASQRGVESKLTMNTASKKHVPKYPLNPTEAKYQKTVNGPSRDIFAGDLVVSNKYQDRARKWYKRKQEKGVHANSTKNRGTMMKDNGSTKWL